MADWFLGPPIVSHRQIPTVSSSSLVMALSLLLLSLVSPTFCIHESMESHSEFTCEPVRLRMCQDLPYNTTFMPNLLNHYDQQTAALAMEVRLCECFSVCECVCVHVCQCVEMR